MTDDFGLVQARAHLRLDSDDTDPMIELFMSAAIDRVEQYIGAPLMRNMAAPEQPEDPGIPFSLKAAVLLFLGDLWENREASTDALLYANASALQLMRPYRVEMGV
ncbi:head-tail connector protein [Herbaspirillum sp. NPDC101397]|uniref:head-tail connector protein n=1 Tax=Herbaspirillum sp. NPDC101397 TaxID=3364006 RepID=UPI00383A7CD5